ncbi:MFS transporter [Phytohabitans rumicis]|uniref:MFS transporter n=1 Tax=Phytohabitans rumicis TaxID=1076125 RepID=A0A6V8LP51_9ACTN|nr:MFS transporter [Phytohabitans rumicis]GFJ95877.1 MFS transporter [Phytohabitans rumicis]
MSLTTAPPHQSQRRSVAALAIIAACQLMVVLDGTVVYVALPKIQADLGFSTANLSWVVNAYTLAFGGLLLLGGRAGDILGHRRIFVAGIALFGLASLAGGLATAEWLLLAARTAQGVGAALAAPTALALIPANFDEGPARTRAIGVYTAVAAAGGAVGLILGGVLSDWASWRWVLFINVPIALAVLLAAPAAIRETPRRPGHFDLAGALASTGGMTALVYGLIRTSAPALAAAGVLLIVFLLREARARQPILPLRLLADRTRAAGYATMLAFPAAMFGMFFFLTQFLQQTHEYSALRTGFAFLPLTLLVLVSSALAAKLIPRFGASPLAATGAAVVTAGMLWVAQISPDTDYATGVLGPVVLFGLGAGLLFAPLTGAILSGVEPADSGAAASLLNAMQQVGGALGLAVLVTVADTASTPIDGMSRAFWVAAAFTATAAILALIARRRQPRNPL